jgi:rhomboid protease GluP
MKLITNNLSPTLVLILINVFIFTLTNLLGLFFSTHIAGLPNPVSAHELSVILGGVQNEFVWQEGQLYRLLTAIFLHANITHLAVNMFSLWQLGSILEKVLTKPIFLFLFFSSGLTASLISSIFQDNTFSVGSSGAIFGFLGSLLVWSLWHKQWFLVRIIGLNLLLNAILGWQIEQIDNWGHMGGFAGGVIITLLLLPEIYKAEKKAKLKALQDDPALNLY